MTIRYSGWKAQSAHALAAQGPKYCKKFFRWYSTEPYLIDNAFAEGGILIDEDTKNRGSFDLLLRELDCLGIETMHKTNQNAKRMPTDSVLGVFWEGEPLNEMLDSWTKTKSRYAPESPIE